MLQVNTLVGFKGWWYHVELPRSTLNLINPSIILTEPSCRKNSLGRSLLSCYRHIDTNPAQYTRNISHVFHFNFKKLRQRLNFYLLHSEGCGKVMFSLLIVRSQEVPLSLGTPPPARIGVPTMSGLGVTTLPDRRASTCYAAGGTPLAVMQEDFLVHK